MTTGSAAAGVSAALAAALFAVDPVGLGGVALRSGAGPAREQWLARLNTLLPLGAPSRRVPLHVNDDRLLGGLDLSATLQAGRPIAQRGLLAEADGGIVLLAMAERLSAATAASIAAVIDTQELVAERHGVGTRNPSRLGVVALDEGIADDEQVPARLRERLAFHLTLPPTATAAADDLPFTRDDVIAARARLAVVRIGDSIVEGICAAALALGIDSIRAAMLACRAARVSAALDARDAVNAQDAALAAALVLAPRATQVPANTAPPDASDAAAEAPEPASQPEPAEAAPSRPIDADTNTHTETGTHTDTATDKDAATHTDPSDSADTSQPETLAGAVDDVVLEAALAAIPPGLLALIALGNAQAVRAPSAGRVGAARLGRSRGRPSGVRRGEPQGGARLNLIETLRAAAPWQALRRREAEAALPRREVEAALLRRDAQAALPGRDAQAMRLRLGAEATLRRRDAEAALLRRGAEAAGRRPGHTARIQVRREDFHVWRFKQRSETTTVFVVDASGSSALHRLAEAKGAVELLLADCYVRRDSVAVIAFRGAGAELLLPPTRSLVRAKRSLAGLPGGGGTPLAAGLDAAVALADAVRRRGATPIVVLLTDGRANIARDGKPGRARAGEDALAAARRMRIEGFAGLLLDTSPQPQQTARELAAAMGARYLPLPHAGAAVLSQAVRSAGAAALPVR